MAGTSAAPPTAYERVAAALAERDTPLSGAGKAHCPAHDDRVESLSVNRGDDRAVVLHCHARCEPAAVLEALDLPADLLSEPAADGGTGRWRTVGRYKYADPATGKHLFTQIRKERGTEKRYVAQPANVQERMRKAGTLPLYGEARLAEARQNEWPVYLVEGEGNADRLQAWADEDISAPDLVAVSHVNGASAWHSFYAERFTGLDVTVVVDRDGPGQAWAAAVEEDLRGVAKSLRFVQSATTGEHDDIVDHLDAGHGLGDLVVWDPTAPQAAEIDRLVRERMQGLRVDRLARAALAAESWEPPTDLGTLDQQLALDLPEREFVVAELMPVGFNVQLVAQYKTGKTTAALNVARALADGSPLFGHFAVRHGSRRVAWWNCELDERTALKWLRDMAFAHPERLHVEHLRGYALNLTDPA